MVEETKHQTGQDQRVQRREDPGFYDVREHERDGDNTRYNQQRAANE
jgi:hypothetical protein